MAREHRGAGRRLSAAGEALLVDLEEDRAVARRSARGLAAADAKTFRVNSSTPLVRDSGACGLVRERGNTRAGRVHLLDAEGVVDQSIWFVSASGCPLLLCCCGRLVLGQQIAEVVVQHLQVLERSGLVHTQKVGRGTNLPHRA